ncbi:MAG TPA: ATP-dependent DNA helicase [Candidatus Micrarchaeaceae archaeon]|nr:ATP-dependent DNA helicase [Candidatus Micrarchaeaceae archaeon]
MSQLDDFSERARAALTPAQLEVVEHLGRGPVKVLAGAGSGKTTTMAWLYTGALAAGLQISNLMAVTFTERAAAELRQKALAVMVEVGIAPEGGTGEALEGAWIGTFHQLIRRLLGERAYLAGLPRDLELLDEVAAGVVMQEALTSVRRQQPGGSSWLQQLPSAPDPHTVLSLLEGASQTVGRMRSTELGPIDCERESLAAYQEWGETGDPPDEIAWHRAALALTTTLWREYEARLARRRALDFDGLLRAGLAALRRAPRLLSWCRSNFRLVIVDEYQDTSALQESLVQALTGPDHGSLFMVGDARQSIYAFRDAKPGIMEDAPGERFGLFLNHRSRMPILAAADHVIKGDPKFAEDQPMEPARGSESPRPVLLAVAEDPAQEAESIAALLDQIHQDGVGYPDGSQQPVRWREMAVLAYTLGRVGPPLEECLRRRGIPFQTASGGLLDRPEVRDLLAYLRLANDELDDLACLRVLQCPVGRVPDRALVMLRPRSDQRDRPLVQRLRSHLAGGAPGWEPSWATRAQRILEVVDALTRASRTTPAGELVAQALDESGLLQLQQTRVRGDYPEGRRALGSLRELQRVAWAAEAPQSWLSLGGLLAQLEVMQAEAKTAEPQAESEEDLVTLSTIHRAKGLEWNVVVLADCRPYHVRGRDSVIWDRERAAIVCSRVDRRPTAAFARWQASPAAAVDRDEHRRLVYVAMTRARDLLLVTTTRPGEESEFMELVQAAAAPDGWVQEWPEFSAASGLPWAAPGGAGRGSGPTAPDFPARQVSISRMEQRRGEIQRMREAARVQSARPSQLSFTAIEVLQQCPRQFWYQYIVHAPVPDPVPVVSAARSALPASVAGRDQALALGSALHRVLERVHKESPQGAPSLAQAVIALDWAAAGLEPELKAAAEEMLRRYLAGPTAALPTVATEFAFSWSGWAAPDLPPLTGVIDRIAKLPSSQLLIIDYKTNLSLSEAELAEYSRQLRLYSAAVEAGVLGLPGSAPETALAMLRSGELLSVASGAPERAEALGWAASAARRVAQGRYRAVEDFPARPCSACPFAERCPERRAEGAPALAGEPEEA